MLDSIASRFLLFKLPSHSRFLERTWRNFSFCRLRRNSTSGSKKPPAIYSRRRRHWKIFLDHYEQVESKVARITELEHRGDFIVHEVMHLLMHTLIIPLDGEDIERLDLRSRRFGRQNRSDGRAHGDFSHRGSDRKGASTGAFDPQRRRRTSSWRCPTFEKKRIFAS